MQSQTALSQAAELLDPARSFVASMRTATSPAHVLLVFDNDGVLCPVIDNPLLSAPSAATVEALSRLTALGVGIAIVSGRRTGFLAGHYGSSASTGLHYRGLLGAEVDSPAGYRMHALGTELEPVVRSLTASADRLRAEGVGIEDKGVTLCLHHGPDGRSTRAAIDFALHGTTPHPGLIVSRHLDADGGGNVEIRPDFQVDKSHAMDELLDTFPHATHVAFLGDAPIDAPAAHALHAASDRYQQTMVVGVQHGLFDQAAMLDASDLVLPTQGTVTTMLHAFADALT